MLLFNITRNLPKGDSNRVNWRFRRFGGHRLWVIHLYWWTVIFGESAERAAAR